MRFLFIVQGEERGHLVEAVTLEEMLIRRGHEVVEILVGGSSARTLPGYFNRNVHAPVKRFVAPKLLTAETGGHIHLGKNMLHNLLHLPEYVRSMCYINARIRKTQADVVVNFHEQLTGFTYLLFRPSVPYVAVGREYMYLHNGFEFPGSRPFRSLLMRLFIRLMSLQARKRLAFSFRPLPADPVNNVVVVPPLLRREVTALSAEPGDYLHGFVAKPSFADQVMEYHEAHPEVSMRFFWDHPDADEVMRMDKTLSFYQPDDAAFLNALAGCHAYAGASGFESICEAMFLGKPVLMIPLHLRQECDAYDALKSRAGIVRRSFALRPLLKFAENYTPDREFMYWARSCERRLINELENLAERQPVPEMVLGV